MRVLPDENAKDVAAQEEEHYRDDARREWWLIGVTVALAFFTGGLWIYTAFLWGSTRSAVRDGKDTAERQMRAYLFIDACQVDGFDDQGPFKMTFRIQNFGKTPAKNVWLKNGAIYVHDRKITGDKSALPSSVGPGSYIDYNISTNQVLPLEVRTAILAETFIMRGVGEIEYCDAFNKTRHTWFAKRYWKDHKGAIRGVLPLGDAQEGNDWN